MGLYKCVKVETIVKCLNVDVLTFLKLLKGSLILTKIKKDQVFLIELGR